MKKNTKIATEIKIIAISIFSFILLPKSIKKKLTIKNLPPLPIKDASANLSKFISKIPEAIAKSLYGIGVNAAKNTAHEPYWS